MLFLYGLTIRVFISLFFFYFISSVFLCFCPYSSFLIKAQLKDYPLRKEPSRLCLALLKPFMLSLKYLLKRYSKIILRYFSEAKSN